MKYVVTAMNVNRKGYQVHTWDDGSITKDEIIDTENNVLFGVNNLILTPHIAASTEEAQLIVAKQIAEQISEFFNTGKITNSV